MTINEMAKVLCYQQYGCCKCPHSSYCEDEADGAKKWLERQADK